MRSQTIQFRFAITMVANIVKMLAMFITGLIIARVLGVSDFGSYSFLVASCTAICALVDMGGNHAFFTFASQQRQVKSFFIGYFIWQLLQVLLVSACIYIVIPDDIITSIWVGEERGVIALAFLAVYLRQQMWTAMVKITEAERANHYGQVANIIIATAHLIVISLMAYFQWLTIELLFVILIGEYIISLLIMWFSVKRNIIRNAIDKPAPEKSITQWFKEYYTYCKPLIGMAIVAFAYAFWDRWILQQYGGSVEQAYLSIAIQLSMLSRTLITSMMPVIWKEMAEEQANGNELRVKELFNKSTKLLFFSVITISWLLIPWSYEILDIALGSDYVEGTVVLMVMLLYPIHASLGSMIATILLATERTTLHSISSLLVMLISMPLAYVMVAPNEAFFPGLGMGALGVALGQVGLQLISVNLLLFYMNKKKIISYEWKHQIILMIFIPAMALLGQEIAGVLSDILVIKVIAMACTYFVGIIIIMWKAPDLSGITHNQIKKFYSMLSNWRESLSG